MKVGEIVGHNEGYHHVVGRRRRSNRSSMISLHPHPLERNRVDRTIGCEPEAGDGIEVRGGLKGTAREIPAS